MKTQKKLRVCLIPRFFSSSGPPSFSQNDGEVSRSLISIFNRWPFSLEIAELRHWVPFLNTGVVESVLRSLKDWRVAYGFFNWSSSQYEYKHNIYTFNTMASILSAARQNVALRDLSERVVNSSCCMSPGALGFLIRCLGSVGMVDEAIRLFDRVKMAGLCIPTVYSYNCFLEALSKANSVELVETRLIEMYDQGIMPDRHTVTTMLRVYMNAGEQDKALQLYKEICSLGWFDLHIGTIMVMGFSKLGQVKLAFNLIEAMEEQNICLGEKTLYCLVHGFVNEGSMDMAILLLEKIKKYGFVPDIAAYDVVIGGLCGKQEHKKAMQLYSEMHTVGVQPDARIVSKLVSSISGVEQFASMLEEIKETLSVASQTLLCTTFLSYLVNNGLAKKAYHLLRLMMDDEVNDQDEIHKLYCCIKQAHLNSESFTFVFDSLLKTGDVDAAFTLFEAMQRNGYERNLRQYNNLIEGLCNKGMLEESFSILQEMERRGTEPTQFTHNCIFSCLCKRKDIAGALSLAKVMRFRGHEPYIKHKILMVKELCDGKKVEEARRFLEDMVKEGLLPDIMPYSVVMDAYVRNNEVDSAVELFQETIARGCRPDLVAYNILIKGMCKHQRMDEAEDLINEMVSKGLAPSIVTYNSLLDGWCKNNQMDKAVNFFAQMKEPSVVTYTLVIAGLFNGGRADEAMGLWDEMGSKGCSPSRIACMAFIQGLCKCGKPDIALYQFKEMMKKKMKPDASVYIALIRAFLADSNMNSGFDVLKMMAENGEFPEPSDKNYESFRQIMSTFLEHGMTSSTIKDLFANDVENATIDDKN